MTDSLEEGPAGCAGRHRSEIPSNGGYNADSKDIQVIGTNGMESTIPHPNVGMGPIGPLGRRTRPVPHFAIRRDIAASGGNRGG